MSDPSSKTESLLPCAHCGSSTAPRLSMDPARQWTDKVTGSEEYTLDEWQVICDASGLESPGCGAASGYSQSRQRAVAKWNRRSAPETPAPRSFQDRVFDWARDCFGERDTTSREMRTYRFLEEALELAQACGCSEESAVRLVTYVYSRPVGEVAQETGGTMVSLAVLCQAFGIGMQRCGEAELERVLGKIEHIRARHAAKPDFGSSVKATDEPSPLTLRDFGYAPGNYYCRCFTCEGVFVGDKRAIQCEKCATEKLARSQVKTSREHVHEDTSWDKP